MQTNFIYLVEGNTEKKLLETLKTEFLCIQPGRISVLNVVQKRIKQSLFASLHGQITSVLIFDTDNDGENMLRSNIEFLRNLPNVKEVLCVPQVKNLEDELSYSCGLKDIRELTNSKSKTDVKRDLLKLSNLGGRLQQLGFSILRLWSRQVTEGFAGIVNQSQRIKLLKK